MTMDSLNIRVTWQGIGVVLALLIWFAATVGTFAVSQYRVTALETRVIAMDRNIQWLLGEAIRSGWIPSPPEEVTP